MIDYVFPGELLQSDGGGLLVQLCIVSSNCNGCLILVDVPKGRAMYLLIL